MICRPLSVRLSTICRDISSRLKRFLVYIYSTAKETRKFVSFKVVIITNLEQKQKSA